MMAAQPRGSSMPSSPSPRNLVWPVDRGGGIQATWDPDQPHMEGSAQPAPYHTIHLPYEPLTTPRIAADADGVLYPVAASLQSRLAAGWESADGDRTWTFRLRPGLPSHAGNELTADDVVWMVERVFALRGVGLWRLRRLAGINAPSDVEALDRHTVRVRLRGPNPQFAAYFVFATGNVVDSVEARRHATEEDPWASAWLSANACGFGQFSVVRHDDDEIEYAARAEHWMGRPGVDSIVQVGVDSRSEALNMLTSGEANMALGLYPEELLRFEGRPEFTTRRVRANHSTLEFNWSEPPFDDRKVRQAVCYALPYDLIIDRVYAGRARRSHSPICSTSELHTAEFDPYRYDLERARTLMRESGHPDGFDTELWVKASYECLRLAHIVRDALAPIGIGVDVRLDTRLPFGTKVPMWVKEECSHALYEPMYDVAHDYDPPLGMWGGKINVDREWSSRIRAIHSADSREQPRIYREIQRDLMEFAACAHIAEIETGWVFRADVDPWALDPAFLGAATTVWSAHRPILGLRELEDEYEW